MQKQAETTSLVGFLRPIMVYRAWASFLKSLPTVICSVCAEISSLSHYQKISQIIQLARGVAFEKLPYSLLSPSVQQHGLRRLGARCIRLRIFYWNNANAALQASKGWLAYPEWLNSNSGGKIKYARCNYIIGVWAFPKAIFSSNGPVHKLHISAIFALAACNFCTSLYMWSA